MCPCVGRGSDSKIPVHTKPGMLMFLLENDVVWETEALYFPSYFSLISESVKSKGMARCLNCIQVLTEKDCACVGQRRLLRFSGFDLGFVGALGVAGPCGCRGLILIVITC